MRRLLAALLVIVLMLSHGSVGPAHAHGSEHDHVSVGGHEHGHHAEIEHQDATPDQPVSGDHGTVLAHTHIVADQAPSMFVVPAAVLMTSSAPLHRAAERPLASATVPPPLKPPSA